MRSVRAELSKLRRSSSWAVLVLLPLMAVGAGTATTIATGEGLDGWDTLWLRVVVFHGLFPLAVGIGVLASLVWRAEHRGGNVNLLMTAPVSTLQIVVGKVAAIAVLLAVMQAVLVAALVLTGKVVFGLPGFLPARYLAISGLIVLAGLPVAAAQSTLSMLMRSFAAPVAIALAGATASTLIVLAELHLLIAVVPYALLARATQLGTGTLADSGAPSTWATATVVAASLGLTAVLTAGSAALLERRDVR
jgi:hypothetical protein